MLENLVDVAVRRKRGFPESELFGIGSVESIPHLKYNGGLTVSH